MDGLRKFFAEDNHDAVKVGDLQWETRSKKVVEPKVTADFLGAVSGKVQGPALSHESKKSGENEKASVVGHERSQR